MRKKLVTIRVPLLPASLSPCLPACLPTHYETYSMSLNGDRDVQYSRRDFMEVWSQVFGHLFLSHLDIDYKSIQEWPLQSVNIHGGLDST